MGPGRGESEDECEHKPPVLRHDEGSPDGPIYTSSRGNARRFTGGHHQLRPNCVEIVASPTSLIGAKPPSMSWLTGFRLAARGGTRVEPRRQDLVRERGARRKSTRVIYDDEQRSYRAKSCLSLGLRRRPVPALSQLLSNVPHCLRRRFALESGRRSQRGPREFHHGLLDPRMTTHNGR